jgi:cysteinyl-tRNA synthetase
MAEQTLHQSLDKFPLYIHNSFSRKKELFKPIHEGKVGLYVCGPTVYGDPHLGHARSAITFDIVYRYLQFLGYKVRYVRNITDVGHLENELAGEGEDKISKKARLEQLEPMEVVQQYTNSYHHSLQQLNVIPPSIEPRASGHIIEQIETIKKILEAGYAYETNGSVYFNLSKYIEDYEYGKLSGKVLEDLQTGNRETEGLTEKKGMHDFALWKKAAPEHIMRWESPWGEGFPGWHVECTAMCTKYLGEHFDIHGGGLDLQFPHHEAEIAQNVAAFGNTPVNYWMHHNLVTIDGQKMSKSLGNFITVQELFEGNHNRLTRAWHPMIIRFFTLQAHYRSPVDFSEGALESAEKGFQKLMGARAVADKLPEVSGKTETAEDKALRDYADDCYRNMSDDFNTPRTIASLFELASKIYSIKNGQVAAGQLQPETLKYALLTFNGFIDDVLALKPLEEAASGEGKTDELVQVLIQLRKDARTVRNFDMADKIRDRLQEIGIRLKDEKGGETTYEIEG